MAESGWVHTGGEFGVGLVYEYRDEYGRRIGRAYVRGDEQGRASVVGFDLDPAAEKRRDELQHALRADLDALAEATIGPGGPSARRLAEWCGINPGDVVRSRRGGKRRPDHELRRFAGDVLRQGFDAALCTWHLSDRRCRELARAAEARGFLVIERTPGRANLYLAPGESDVSAEPVDAVGLDHGDLHRSARIRRDEFRGALQANWQRARGRNPTVEEARAARRAVRERTARQRGTA
jgi:hypothetical protein